MKRQTIVEIISALFMLLFTYTAFNKFVWLTDLQEVLKKYPLIGGFSDLVAWGLPITESILVLLLFFPRTKLIGLYSSSAMMVAFTLYLGYMLLYTPKLPCTCGGMLQKLSWPQHLMFNIIFVLLGIIAIRLHKKNLTREQLTETTPIVFT